MNYNQPRVTAMDITLQARTLEERKLYGTVRLDFDRTGYAQLEIGALIIKSVSDNPEPAQPQSELITGFGRYLSVHVPDSLSVSIEYETETDTPGMQYLKPAETGSQYPLLRTLAKVNLISAFVPYQNLIEAVRLKLQLKVPKHLRGVAQAIYDRRTADDDDSVTEHWHWPKPLPLTNLSFAIGHLDPLKLRYGVRIWFLPHVIDSAIKELGEEPTHD